MAGVEGIVVNVVVFIFHDGTRVALPLREAFWLLARLRRDGWSIAECTENES